LRELWGPNHSEDNHYLRVFIGRLRSKLGDDPTNPRYIETRAGVGYRFISEHEN
jgi:two-component system KDP operon response regulator KdpE